MALQHTATVSRQSSFQIDRSGLVGPKILKPTRVKEETQDLPRKFANFHNRNGALQMTTLNGTGMETSETAAAKGEISLTMELMAKLCLKNSLEICEMQAAVLRTYLVPRDEVFATAGLDAASSHGKGEGISGKC